MVRFLRNNDDEVLKGNTYYWKITKLLPDGVKDVERKFKLCGMTWTYCAFFYEGYLYTTITSICTDIAYLDRFFDIRVGIVGEDLKEIAASNTDVISNNKLISSAQLDSILLANKLLYLFVEIERIGENGQRINVRKQKIEADFRQLLFSGKNSDVIIKVKHKKFDCHRCILGARSPVFAAMFERDMKEKASGIVTIEDAEPAVFQEFLLYLYSGNDDLLSWKYVADLYKLADKYDVEDIKIVCLDDIKQNINKENFFHFFKLSRENNYPNITEIIIQFFLKESKEIVRCKNWVTCLSENPVECNTLITTIADKLSKLMLTYT